MGAAHDATMTGFKIQLWTLEDGVRVHVVWTEHKEGDL